MIEFAKVESIGNDFVLIKPTSDLEQLAVRLCERRFGVGSDGLLVVSPAPAGVLMRMFNPDGTEDFCGNGLRCAAVYAHEKGWVGERFSIQHGGLQVPCSIDHGAVSTVLRHASFLPEDVPLDPAAGSGERFLSYVEIEGETLELSALSTGSTHTILRVDELPDNARFHRISKALENHSLFPRRTSVIWSRTDDPTNLTIRIWERGAGETLGCGTGSSAAAVVHARAMGLAGTFAVHNPGGTVQVELAEGWSGDIRVVGTARVVYEGVFVAA